MSDANETIAAIVAEMRKAVVPMICGRPKIEAVSIRDVLQWADRIEAAAKRGCATLEDALSHCREYAKKIERENEEGETRLDAEEIIATVDNEFAGIRPEHAPGNDAALREALEFVLQFDATDEAAEEDGLTDAERIAEYADHIEECQKKARAALAAPARNCDVGTAAEQKARHDRFCSRHYKAECVDSQCFGCPAHDEKTETDCEFVWGQLPFAQAEGGAKCIDGLRGHPDCRGCDEHCLDVRKRNCFYWNPDIGKCALDGKPSCRIACDNFCVSKEEKPDTAEGGAQ